MSKLVWDKDGERLYETGVKNVVLYVQGSDGAYGKGVAWNGVTSISESPSGGDANDLYADDTKYLSLRSLEDLGATIEAYTYPDEFMACDGSESLANGVYIGQQTRKPFALCYRTSLGNDTDGDSHGYKLHLLYNATASPSERSYSTINDSPEAITFSWELTTIAVPVPGHKNTSLVTIDSTAIAAEKLTALENMLYGTESAEPKFPTIEELIALVA